MDFSPVKDENDNDTTPFDVLLRDKISLTKFSGDADADLIVYEAVMTILRYKGLLWEEEMNNFSTYDFLNFTESDTCYFKFLLMFLHQRRISDVRSLLQDGAETMGCPSCGRTRLCYARSGRCAICIEQVFPAIHVCLPNDSQMSASPFDCPDSTPYHISGAKFWESASGNEHSLPDARMGRTRSQRVMGRQRAGRLRYEGIQCWRNLV